MDLYRALRRDRDMQPTRIDSTQTARRHPRVPASFPFVVEHPLGCYRLKARNLSMTGMLATDELEVPEGLVRVEAELPEEDEPLRLEAWASRRADGLALRFVDLDLPTILALARYISPHL